MVIPFLPDSAAGVLSEERKVESGMGPVHVCGWVARRLGRCEWSEEQPLVDAITAFLSSKGMPVGLGFPLPWIQ